MIPRRNNNAVVASGRTQRPREHSLSVAGERSPSKNATKSSYKVPKSYRGKRISVQVTGKKSGYATIVKTSKATGKVK